MESLKRSADVADRNKFCKASPYFVYSILLFLVYNYKHPVRCTTTVSDNSPTSEYEGLATRN